MLYRFLRANEDELVETCRAKVSKRRAPRPTEEELEHGVPLFLDQLIEMLEVDGDRTPSRMVADAADHGSELLARGFTVAQVIHDYGDLCQAITELAVEKEAPITAREFGALNRALDDAIAAAVTEHARQRERDIELDEVHEADERVAFLAHELRNSLDTALLSFEVIKRGSVAINGATSAIHDQALRRLRALADNALAEVRLAVGLRRRPIRLADLIDDVESGAVMAMDAVALQLEVEPVDPELVVNGDFEILTGVVGNLLQNAFKFTRENGGERVSLRVSEEDDRVFIEVEDECGGLPPGAAEDLMLPFEQRSGDRSGLGVGLTICQRGVEAHDGVLHVRDLPGKGCIFTVELPREHAG